jgi:hypothetical protein
VRPESIVIVVLVVLLNVAASVVVVEPLVVLPGAWLPTQLLPVTQAPLTAPLHVSLAAQAVGALASSVTTRPARLTALRRIAVEARDRGYGRVIMKSSPLCVNMPGLVARTSPTFPNPY